MRRSKKGILAAGIVGSQGLHEEHIAVTLVREEL